MSWTERATLAAKGVCMGAADVIPGVSGGTMALILGIYVRFIEAIKSLNLRFVRPFFAWIASGFKRARLTAVSEAIGTIHLGFLVPLGLGIAVAFVAGSKFIPELMDRYPVVMRAFFFGLVLASVWVPYRLMTRRGPRELASAVVFGALAYLLVGLSTEHSERWGTVEVAGEGQTVEELALSVPSALTPAQLLALSENAAALSVIADSAQADAAELRLMAQSEDPRHTMVNELVVPAGVSLHVPRPPYWWIFMCGFIAVCAMILPGISGSFFLLALGSYYFMLNALKGFLKGLVHLELSGSHTLFVGLFVLAMLLGLASFSRVLSYLFKRFPSVTLAAMTGLMLGCLRRIWPFRLGGENVLPEGFDSVVVNALGAFALGAAIVIGLNFVGTRRRALVDG